MENQRNPEFLRDPEAFLKARGAVLPSFISLAEAKEKASDHSKNIFANWETLKDILSRHEETIRSRWAEKSKRDREDVLERAWDNIPKDHHPEWKACLTTASERGLAGPIRAPNAKFRDRFLLPHINLEDLSNR